MTLIKSISAKGFKSFAKSTDIPFRDGFNIVIGSNGSGKSNICDALCFVLGKTSAKGLRAEKSANLIYNGGKTKDPAKQAEVTIVFDNSKNTFPIKDKEVKITRVVKQSGNSIYKINEDVMTRQQVVDLLSAARIDPDGHNIVLQGDIIRFMEMKPENRRELVDEIAGISVYEDKKEKAVHELDNVEVKLKEADIILAERETYLRELKKDRDQALKYKDLEKSIKDNKATYIHLQLKAKETEKEALESKISSQSSEIEKVKNKIDELRKDIEDKSSEIKIITSELDSKGEKEQLKLSKEIDDLKTIILKDESRIETCKTELGRIKSRSLQLKKDLEDIDLKISALNKQKNQIHKIISDLSDEEGRVVNSIAKFKEKHGINNLDFTKIEGIDSEIESNQQGLLMIQGKKQELIAKKNALLLNIKSLEEKIDASLNTKKEDQEKLNKLKSSKSDLRKIEFELKKALDDSSALALQLAISREKIVNATEELAKLRGRQLGVRERVSGDISIKKVLELKNGIFGTVSDLGNVSSKYNLALEVAAGQRIKSVVVDTDVTASKCIKYLKDNKLGVVTFLPLNKLNPPHINDEVKKLANKPGVKGLAVDLISYDSKYKNVFLYVFGSTLIVENINTARQIGIGSTRMATLEGDLIEASGAMIGGFRRSSGAFKEKDMEGDISKFESDISRFNSIVDALEDRKADNEKKVFNAKEKKAFLEVEISSLERATAQVSDLSALKDEKARYEKRIKDLDSEFKNLDSELKDCENKLRVLKNQRDAARKALSNTKISEELSKFESRKQEINLKSVEVKAEIRNIDTQINTLLAAEKDRIHNILKQHVKEKESFEQESDSLSSSIKSNKECLKEKEALERKYSAEFKSLFAKRGKMNDQVKDRENNIIRESDKIKYIESRINSLNLERAKTVSELEGLNKEFEDYTDAKIRKNINLDELKYEIKKFESLLSSMGNVNLRALEIYEEINKQYEEITSKVDKLKTEKDDVLKLMKEIDSKKQEVFMKTFREIHKNFKEIFSNLSTKGEAHLELENPENVFEGGVDIKVKLTGSKSLDIKSLSGGEKTLAALSFIFAIQEHSPASFYLFDEVDAALDSRNSEVLSKLIQKYSRKAQYIVISHNDKVINDADQVYGVSMQDGISKVVSLKV